MSHFLAVPRWSRIQIIARRSERNLPPTGPRPAIEGLPTPVDLGPSRWRWLARPIAGSAHRRLRSLVAEVAEKRDRQFGVQIGRGQGKPIRASRLSRSRRSAQCAAREALVARCRLWLRLGAERVADMDDGHVDEIQKRPVRTGFPEDPSLFQLLGDFNQTIGFRHGFCLAIVAM